MTEGAFLLAAPSQGEAEFGRDPAGTESSQGLGLPAPGTDCPTCNRRIPRPKTEASPPTKKMAYWTAADSSEDHKALIAAAGKYLGCYDQPFFEAKVMEIGVVLILQDKSLEGFASRAPFHVTPLVVE